MNGYLIAPTKGYAKLRILFITVIVLFLFSCAGKSTRYISQEYRNYLNDTTVSTMQIPSGDSAALDYFLRGVQFEQQGLFADAIIEFEDAYRTDSSAIILYAIGKNYFHIYKYDRAEEYLKKAIIMDSNLVPALDMLGQVYLKSFRRNEAKKVFEELYNISPGKKYLFTLAYLYEFLDVKKSIELYEKILKNDNDASIIGKLALLYLNEGDTAKHISTLEKAYAKSRDNSEFIKDLFDSYVETGLYTKASKLLDTTNYRLPTSELTEMFIHIGEKLAKCDDKKAGTLKKNYISKIDSRFYFNWPLIAITGFMNISLNDTAKGEEMLSRAINLADTVPELILQVSEYLQRAGKTDKSLQLIESYESKFDKDTRFQDMKGFIFLTMDSLDKARDLFLISLKKNNRNALTLTQLGIIYDRMKKADSSDYYYIQSLLLDPDDPLTNNNYAYSLSLRKIELDKALKLSRKSLEEDSLNASYLDTYGWILFQMGKYDESIVYLKKSLDTGDASGEVYEHLGEVYLKKGDQNAALEIWKKGIMIEPDNEILLEKIDKFKR